MNYLVYSFFKDIFLNPIIDKLTLRFMKKLFTICFIALFLGIYNIKAQYDTLVVPLKYDVITIGPGMGFDYGGFGFNLTVYPQKNIGLFAGGGYALAGFGFNGGLKIRFVSDQAIKKTNIYLIGMYGYNAAIKVSGSTEYDKLFYGPTFGIGLDYRKRPGYSGYWSIALLIPVRSSEVSDYMDDLENNHGVDFKTGLVPIGISIGYKFILQ